MKNQSIFDTLAAAINATGKSPASWSYCDISTKSNDRDSVTYDVMIRSKVYPDKYWFFDVLYMVADKKAYAHLRCYY